MKVGRHATVRICVSAVKDKVVALARQADAHVRIIGRSSRPGTHERLLDLTYAIVRDSPFPVLEYHLRPWSTAFRN